MKQTTIMLPHELDARLRLEARRRGTSIEDVVRDAIERQLPAPQSPGPLGFFAIGDGGADDVSENVDTYVAAALRERET
jgi:plasmid stability protein